MFGRATMKAERTNEQDGVGISTRASNLRLQCSLASAATVSLSSATRVSPTCRILPLRLKLITLLPYLLACARDVGAVKSGRRLDEDGDRLLLIVL